MTTLPGDPASLSSVGATLRRTAHTLRADAEAIEAARTDLNGHWTGRASVTARSRAETLAAAMTTTADRLDRAGRALHNHASDLAAAQQDYRRLADEYATHGLEVRDRGVHPAYGLLETADPATERDRAAARETLETRLAAILLHVDRWRTDLGGVLDRLDDDCAATAAALRGR